MNEKKKQNLLQINNNIVINLPFYYSPFKLGRSNLMTGSLKEYCNQYFLQYSGKTNVQISPKLFCEDLHLWYSLFYPKCVDRVKLEVVGPLGLFQTWVDDVLAEDLKRDRKTDSAKILLMQYYEQIDYYNGNNTINLMKWEPYMIGHYTCLKQILDKYSPQQKMRLIETIKSFLTGNKEELSLIDDAYNDWTLEQMVEMRTKSCCTIVWFQLIEYVYDIELTNDEWYNPLIQIMINECAKSVFLCNDFNSFRKELVECNGDINICPNVIAFMVKQGKSLQKAYDYVRDMIVETDDKVHNIVKQIKDDGTKISYNLSEFIDNLMYAVGGSWLFHIKSRRYHGTVINDFMPLSGRLIFDPNITIIEPNYDHPNKYEALKQYLY